MRPVIKVRLIPLLSVVLTRESDESAITAEERQHALTVLLDAAGRLRDTAESVKAARSLNRAAYLQFRLNRPQDALVTYRDALAAHESAPDVPTDVDSLNGIGDIHGYLSECDEAKEVLQRAFALSEQVGYVAGKAQALLAMSGCFED